MPTLTFNSFFADYDFNKPLYRSYTGYSIQVKDSGGTTHDIGFTAGGLLDKAACDAIGTNLKIQKLYDKSGNSRDVTIVSGSGDAILKWDTNNVPYYEPSGVDVRFETASTHTVSNPKVFAVARTIVGEAYSYLCDFGGNKFAVAVTEESFFGYNGNWSYRGGVMSETNNKGLHSYVVLFGSGTDNMYFDRNYYAGGSDAGGTSRTEKITVGNYYAGTYNGLHHHYDLKIVDGSMTTTEIEEVIDYQMETCYVAQENVVVTYGDSLTEGYNPGGGNVTNDLSEQLLTLLGTTYWVTYNEGHSGYTSTQLLSSPYIDNAIAHYRPTKTNWLVLNVGFNDFNLSFTEATTKANIASLVSSLQTAGFTVVLRTMPKSDYYTTIGDTTKQSQYVTWRSNMNTWIKAGTSGADYVLDETGDANIGDSGDTTSSTYFFSDRIHGKEPYYGIIANLAYALIIVPPDDVTGVTVNPISDTEISLDWDNVSGAINYRVYYNTSNSHTGESYVDTSSSTSSKIVSGLTSGTTYYFWVKAQDAYGAFSDNYSSSVSATTFTGEPTIQTFKVLQTCPDFGLERTIAFARQHSNVGQGYKSSALVDGADTGLKRWKLAYSYATQTLDHSAYVGWDVFSQAEYLWNFFCEHSVTGEPFVITDPMNGNYYLAEFSEDTVTFTKQKTKIWVTGFLMEQRRLPNISVFDITKLSQIVSNFDASVLSLSNNANVTAWADAIGNLDLTGSSTYPVFKTNIQNGKSIVRWSGTSSRLTTSTDVNIRHIWAVLKHTDSSYSADACALADSNNAYLYANGANYFNLDTIFGAGIVEARVNGSLVANDSIPVPYNTWQVVELRFLSTYIAPDFHIGSNQDNSVKWKGDIGEVIIANSAILPIDANEVSEHLANKWGI